MDPETEKAIRRLEKYRVGVPEFFFKGAVLCSLILALMAVGLWLVGYLSRHLEAIFG
jgi:hypothetical protein